jgi:hypothetical protein
MEPRTLLLCRWARIAARAAFLGVQAYVVSTAWAQTLSVALPTPTITVPLGGSGTQSLTLNNTSGAALGYRVGASGTVLMPFYEADSQSVASGFRSTIYTDPGVAGSQAQLAADDFSLASSTSVASIVFQSFVVSSQPLDVAAQTLTFSIYPDAGGVPAGNPHNQPGTAIWSFTTLPTAPGVSIVTTGSPPVTRTELNLAAAGQSLTLAAGNYWLVVNSVGTFANRVAWLGSLRGSGAFASLTVSSTGTGTWQTINPFRGLAMRLNQSENCGAAWLAAASGDSGIAPANGSAAVQLTASAGALTPGTYTTDICVASGPEGQRSLQRVPITMVVYDPENARKVPTLSNIALGVLGLLMAALGVMARRRLPRRRR